MQKCTRFLKSWTNMHKYIIRSIPTNFLTNNLRSVAFTDYHYYFSLTQAAGIRLLFFVSDIISTKRRKIILPLFISLFWPAYQNKTAGQKSPAVLWFVALYYFSQASRKVWYTLSLRRCPASYTPLSDGF